MVKPIPDGYHGVTPYLIVHDAKAAIDFYTRAFGAKEKFRMPRDDKIGHAELEIGGGHVMLADEHPELGYLGPRSRGGTPVSLMLYVEDVDHVFRAAIEAGATETKPVENQFWGDRMGSLTDPFGHAWSLATHVEDLSDDELQQRMREVGKSERQGEPA